MKTTLLGIISLVLLSGCATTGINTKTGPALVSAFQESGMATTEGSATKIGQACSQNILGIASTGDSTIDAAKRAGGITKVSSVDYDVLNILFLYGKVCTIVRGM